MLEYVDAGQFIDGLCQELENAQFGDYSTEQELVSCAGDAVTEYAKSELGKSASVWVEGRDKGKIK